MDDFDAAESFRAEVRQFCAERLPDDLRRKVNDNLWLDKADYVRYMRLLDERGWAVGHWPREYGGCGWSHLQRFVFEEETTHAGAPWLIPFGVNYVGPVIYTFGSQAQKDRFLPPIRSTTEWWAQGYSEPGAGSDLASLRTRAVRQGDEYVVDGEKIWTSDAHHADWIFCLVRTADEPKKQAGITFLCMPMDTPGIEVKPIITIDGGHHLNRVTFTGVRVPVENRIGEEGQGWTYARHLLAHERTSYAHVAAKRRQIAQLKEISQSAPWGDLLGETGAAAFRRKLAEVELQLQALEMTTLRALAPLASGEAPGDEASIIKIAATETAQAVTELFLELAGPYAQPFFPDRRSADWRGNLGDIPAFAAPGTASYFFTRAQTIYGGATEIQKNIIARQLGL